jgi:hypothetical protein
MNPSFLHDSKKPEFGIPPSGRMENHPGGGVMRAPKERFDLVHEFLSRVLGDDLHAKRILSLTNGTLGVMTGAALAVSLIGQALATARGLIAKSAIKQVDRLLLNAFAILLLTLLGRRRKLKGSKWGGTAPASYSQALG